LWVLLILSNSHTFFPLQHKTDTDYLRIDVSKRKRGRRDPFQNLIFLLNVKGELLAILLRISVSIGSNLGPETGYPEVLVMLLYSFINHSTAMLGMMNVGWSGQVLF
jgi:hypothetical protein